MRGRTADKPSETKSKNWDKFKNTTTFVQDGFPFDEGFPPLAMGRAYHIVTRDGTHYLAEVDFSTQYRAEGKEWKTVSRRESDGSWRRCQRQVYAHVVLCWMLHESEPASPQAA